MSSDPYGDFDFDDDDLVPIGSVTAAPEPLLNLGEGSGCARPEKRRKLDDDNSENIATLIPSSPPPARRNITSMAGRGSYYAPNGHTLRAPLTGLRQTTLFGRTADNVPPSDANKRHFYPGVRKDEPPTHHQLDRRAMETWVYPTNLGKIRDYQFNIVQKALFHNTLVALPTGLGKTFIAATVMLNWYRWTTNAQIIFVAPTKPLVSQQVEACFKTAGIPRSVTTMLTGEVSPVLREAEWESKRVFFMTAQTLINDLKKGCADPKRIVLLVVDEAHRATGAYSYVEVVRFIVRFNQSFRVLALTATPGATIEAVQNVIDGLKISRIEIRTEESIDIRDYVHQRQIDKRVFDDTEEMALIIELYNKALRPLAEILKQQNATWTTDPSKMTPYGLTQERSRWMATAGRNAPHWQKGLVAAVSTVLSTFAYALDMLLYHGITPFYQKMDQFRQEVRKDLKKMSKYKKQVYENEHFNKMMDYLDTWTRNPSFVGHPKLEYLNQRLMEHFLDSGEGAGTAPRANGTKVMVFANWRSSAEDIVRVLKKQSPIIRPHVFVGQAKSNDSEGMSQKVQQEVIEKFKNGGYNTLVATSIGEEGLDIGEVDLICCYDSKSSPIRMLQRMGRTGRKRAGRIILLQMRGKEETQAENAKLNYQQMQEMIASGSKFEFHDDASRRILPRDVVPTVDKRPVEIPLENSQADTSLPIPSTQGRKTQKQKRKPKKFHMPDDVETGFVTANGLIEGEGVVPTQADNSPADIPPLGDVVLSRADEADFQHRYLNTAGDDNDVVSAPRLDRFPHHQIKPSRSFLIPSRQDSRTLSAMLKRMHDMGSRLSGSFPSTLESADLDLALTDSSLARPVAEPVMPHAASHSFESVTRTRTPAKPRRPAAPLLSSERSHRNYSLEDMAAEVAFGESSQVHTSPRMAIPTQGIELGADTDYSGEEEEEEPDSELARFVIGDDEGLEVFSSSLPERPRKGGLKRRMNKVSEDEEDDDSDLESLVGVTAPRARVNRVIDDDDEDDDELPELRTVIDPTRWKNQPGAVPPLNRLVKTADRRKNRVIDTDDDDDELTI